MSVEITSLGESKQEILNRLSTLRKRARRIMDKKFSFGSNEAIDSAAHIVVDTQSKEVIGAAARLVTRWEELIAAKEKNGG